MTERILVVEDDPRLAEMLSEYLGQAGFRVTVAPLGRAALERLSAAEYDAVVLDLMLPDMDGLDVCRQLRTTSDTPVLMLTGRGDAIDRIVGLEIGADDYLPKPFEPRELLARLRAILRRRVSGQTLAERPLRRSLSMCFNRSIAPQTPAIPPDPVWVSHWSGKSHAVMGVTRFVQHLPMDAVASS